MPNFHKYVQTRSAGAPGTVILERYRTAGQYRVEKGEGGSSSGQFVMTTGAGSEPLYIHVERPTDPA